MNLIAKVIATGKSTRRNGPCELHRPGGNVCYVTDVVFPVLDATRRVIGTVIVFRDATDDLVRERDWLIAADKACYAAKTGGGGEVQLAVGSA